MRRVFSPNEGEACRTLRLGTVSFIIEITAKFIKLVGT